MIIKKITVKNNMLILGKDIVSKYKDKNVVITITNDNDIIISTKELNDIKDIILCKRIKIYAENRLHIPNVIKFHNKDVQLKCIEKENNIITYVKELF